MRNILIGAGFILLTILAISFTPIGANVASVIGATDSRSTACIAEAAKQHPNLTLDTVDVIKADLNDDGTDDRVLKLTDSASCGTSGCIHEICLLEGSTVTVVTFGYAANTLTVLGTKTNGLYDLALNDTIHLSWDGERYAFAE